MASHYRFMNTGPQKRKKKTPQPQWQPSNRNQGQNQQQDNQDEEIDARDMAYCEIPKSLVEANANDRANATYKYPPYFQDVLLVWMWILIAMLFSICPRPEPGTFLYGVYTLVCSLLVFSVFWVLARLAKLCFG
uniref:Protein YIPF n=1 Tax=Panagrellus redivivus TaxID=6233 RepID=A0A7E4ZUB6_PANRE